jgi:TPR repeat protein
MQFRILRLAAAPLFRLCALLFLSLSGYGQASNSGDVQASQTGGQLTYGIHRPTQSHGDAELSQTEPEPTSSEAEWYAEAKRSLDVKDYVKSLPLLNKAAEAGNAAAMYDLGELYYYGQGVPQDYARARAWYQKAAVAGSALAMADLGYLYEHGFGVAQDYAQACTWYQKAADAGNGDAMNNLGMLYANGWGVARDDAQAREWLQKAAGIGNASARDNLNRLFSNTEVSETDKINALFKLGRETMNTQNGAGDDLPASQKETAGRDWYEAFRAFNKRSGDVAFGGLCATMLVLVMTKLLLRPKTPKRKSGT